METVGVVLGVIGIALTIWVAVWQQRQLTEQKKQLAQLEVIGRQTKESANKLRTDQRNKVVADNFFGLKDSLKLRYKCVFPVHSDRHRPLPSIEAGDYYALTVIKNLLGERLDLEPVDFESGGLLDHHCEGNVAFLCTPQVNWALRKVLPPVMHDDGRPPRCPVVEGQELPSWFGEQKVNENTERRIFVADDNRWIESPAEPAYRYALAHNGRVPDASRIQKDYAIVMRVTLAGRKVIVLAGIHQYGTWAAGRFLDCLAQEDVVHRDLFLGNDDILAVVWGEFDHETFSVVGCNVHDDLLWTRAGAGEWQRFARRPRKGDQI